MGGRFVSANRTGTKEAWASAAVYDLGNLVKRYQFVETGNRGRGSGWETRLLIHRDRTHSRHVKQTS